MSKLTKQELEKRKKQHERKVEFYDKKIKELEEQEKRIGFRYSQWK